MVLTRVLKTDEYRMAKRVLMVEGSAGRIRARPRFDWMHGVKVALSFRLRNVRKMGTSREPWRMHM